MKQAILQQNAARKYRTVRLYVREAVNVKNLNTHCPVMSMAVSTLELTLYVL